jgi:hypothetical protein
MTYCDVVILVDKPNEKPVPLENAWVYWREGGKQTLLRTDSKGCPFSAPSGTSEEDAGLPWKYTVPFGSQIGAQVEVYYSRGEKPLLAKETTDYSDVFFARELIEPPPTVCIDPQYAAISPEDINTLTVVPLVSVTLPHYHLELTAPKELTLWSLLWENPTDDYYTSGLNQGAALWQGQGSNFTLNITENSAAPALAANSAERPIERALKLTANVDARVNEAFVYILDRSGRVVKLRKIENNQITANAVSEVKATLKPPAGEKRPLEAIIAFDRAVDAFGPVQILIRGEGINPPLEAGKDFIIDAFYVYLCGFQIGLVDDYLAHENGLQRGPFRTESDEVNIVDFHIPSGAQPTTAADMRARTRARRMLSYQFQNRRRPLHTDLRNPPANNPQVLKPQMPMWMAEFQMVGVTRDLLRDIMKRLFRRAYEKNPPPPPEQNNQSYPGATDPCVALWFELSWRLTLKWNAPDSRLTQRTGQTTTYEQHFDLSHTASLYFREDGTLRDAVTAEAGAQVVLCAFDREPGMAINYFPNLPTDTLMTYPQGRTNYNPNVRRRISFPADNRRRAQVVVQGLSRPWGRQAGAVQKECFIIEFQPYIAEPVPNDNDREVMRGGDGILKLISVKINTQAVETGYIRTAPGTNNALTAAPAPAADNPLILLPHFRVRGMNPPDAQSVLDLLRALVNDYYDRFVQQARVHALSRDCWYETMRQIMVHESGVHGNNQMTQFEDRASHRRIVRWGGHAYGLPLDMPLFGPPHGFGIGQLDLIFNRGCTKDEAFSFVENVRSAVRLLMEEKANIAFNQLGGQLPALANPATPQNLGERWRWRSAYQRQIVRLYNGGSEIQIVGGQLRVHPTLMQNGVNQFAQFTQNPNGSYSPHPNLTYPNHVLGPDITYYNQPNPAAPPVLLSQAFADNWRTAETQDEPPPPPPPQPQNP